MRRLLVPLLLVVLAAGAATQAWLEDDRLDASLEATEDDVVDTSPVALRTPVLAVRRAPRWLQLPTAEAELREAMTALVDASPPATCLRVDHRDRTLHRHQADAPLVPASTMKLLTGYTALSVLGADATLRTVVGVTAPVEAGVVAGDLIVIGGGDPMLATASFVERYDEPRPFNRLEELADAVVDAGVEVVEGDVVGDDGRYDRQRTVPSWDPVFVSNNQAGPLGALAVNQGLVSFPETATTNRGAQRADDPAAHTATVLAALLAERGVAVSGEGRSGTRPDGTEEIAVLESAPMQDLVAHLITTSDNFAAEVLIKEVGRVARGAGTTDSGLEVVREELTAAGLPVEGMVINDGSGLDRGTRLSCDLLTGLLDHVGVDSVIGQGLAVMAERGTLRDRLVDTEAAGRVLAKTGSVRNARALAGFAMADLGEALTFAYIANDDQIDGEAVTLVQDLLALWLVNHPNEPPLDPLTPLPVRSAS